MKTGALIFAFNNEEIDYVKMAAWTANNVRRHLNIPTCIVTDIAPTIDQFDHVILTTRESGGIRKFDDTANAVTWYNASRTDAYDLTPWERTLVLDADYVVASNQLRTVINYPCDFLCFRWAHDITNLQSFGDLNYFGRYHMPMSWATVMWFRKCNHTQMIFDTMNMVKQNWNHYRNLYNVGRSVYRNDHALSIALNLTAGHTDCYPTIPWSMSSLTPAHKLTQIDIDRYRIEFSTSDNKPRWIEVNNQDFHAMGKQQLGEVIANYS